MFNNSTGTHIDPPRYTRRPFPPYRYLPFQGRDALPHPRNDPGGHSYAADEDYLPHFTPDDWPNCEPYLYGIDLFNHGYWWEAHEALETVWLAAGTRETQCGLFVQGLIQLAAAQLKRVIGSPTGAQSLTAAGCEKLAPAHEVFLGIDVALLIADAQRCLQEDRGEFPMIVLHFPSREKVGL
jgi:predicted metal-dependent hydrolase